MIPNCDYYSTILQDITFEPTIIQDPKIELNQIASTPPNSEQFDGKTSIGVPIITTTTK
jgi:hypothetical protein